MGHLFKQVDDAYGHFRGTEVIAPVVVDALAAGGTIVFIVIHIEVAQADLGADIHAVAHDPLVTVGESATIQLPLETIVFEDTQREITKIKDTARGMYTPVSYTHLTLPTT